MAAANGGSEQRLLQCFRESTSSILQLSELQQWWRQGDSKGKEEEVEVRASDILSCGCPPSLLCQPYGCFSLQQLLQQLVERGEVGCRVLTARGSQYTVYWLKKQHGTYDDGDLELRDGLLMTVTSSFGGGNIYACCYVKSCVVALSCVQSWGREGKNPITILFHSIFFKMQACYLLH